ncbi:MAG: calcium/sodium antiporter [Muribaculaceae bacterium]|nr:calcium/sodium antiporter [Muribaculaceae bacterium]
MWVNVIYLLIGLFLILWGANALIDGSAAIAKRWGVSDLIIGLTIVALGTSAPELTISIISAIKDNADLAIGNVVGSNIFNVLVIIGVTALFRPIKIERSIMTNEIPLVLLSSFVLLVIGNSKLLDSVSIPEITRTDGILLLFFFIIFLRYTFSQVGKEPGDKSNIKDHSAEPSIKAMKMWKASIWVISGLGALIFGGDRFVAGASGIASGLGVSDAIIGLTIVAAGTSLPELATSVTAALKGQTGIALGNVIGSNIYNIFLVLGCSATIRSLPFGDINNIDLLTLTGGCILFWFFGWFIRERTITRVEGGILTLCYIGYLTYLILSI